MLQIIGDFMVEFLGEEKGRKVERIKHAYVQKGKDVCMLTCTGQARVTRNNSSKKVCCFMHAFILFFARTRFWGPCAIAPVAIAHLPNIWACHRPRAEPREGLGERGKTIWIIGPNWFLLGFWGLEKNCHPSREQRRQPPEEHLVQPPAPPIHPSMAKKIRGGSKGSPAEGGSRAPPAPPVDSPLEMPLSEETMECM